MRSAPTRHEPKPPLAAPLLNVSAARSGTGGLSPTDPTSPRCCQRAEGASTRGDADPSPQEPALERMRTGYPWEAPAHPRRLVLAQSKTLCTAVTPSRPMGATSPPVMMA